MTTLAVTQIRELINASRESDLKSGALTAHLNAKAQFLHPLLALPSSHPRAALVGFVTRYMSTLPELLDALAIELQHPPTSAALRPITALIEGYFLGPQPTAGSVPGCGSETIAILDRAYLSYRLLEEINDRLRTCAGRPLLAIDMNFANLMVHELLGEDFANQLDLAVHFAIESFAGEGLFDPEGELTQHLRESPGSLETFPNLLEDFAIELVLDHSGSHPLH